MISVCRTINKYASPLVINKIFTIKGQNYWIHVLVTVNEPTKVPKVFKPTNERDVLKLWEPL